MRKFHSSINNFILILLLFYIFYCECYEVISISLISDCTNNQNFECALSTVKCTQVNNEESIRLKLKWLQGSLESTLILKSNKIVPHFNVTNTSRRRQDITKETLYHAKTTFPKQFKSNQEFYGWKEDNNASTFVRGIVHFIGCGQVHFFGFIREDTRFYHIRPLLENLSNKDFKAIENQVHEIIDEIQDLDLNSTFFTNRSKAIKNLYDFDQKFLLSKKHYPEIFEERTNLLQNKHCQIHVKVDESFYRHMNSDPKQIAIYVQTAFILLNEIFQNSKWPEYEEYVQFHRYSFSFRSLDIVFTFGKKYFYLTKEVLENLLSEIEGSSNYCLVYVFTGREIFSNDFTYKLNGIDKTDGVFSRENTAASTVTDCGNPWRLKCFEIFIHEVIHTMGAYHDEDNTPKLMNPVNDLTLRAMAANLILSEEAIDRIVIKTFLSHKHQSFLPAIDHTACGNSVVELGEQCDEGHEWGNTERRCCDSKCELIANAQCSPHNSLCCTDKCEYKPNSVHCIPWNYCANEELFCQSKLDFCWHDRIQVKCQPNDTAIKKTTKTIPKTTTTSKIELRILLRIPPSSDAFVEPAREIIADPVIYPSEFKNQNSIPYYYRYLLFFLRIIFIIFVVHGIIKTWMARGEDSESNTVSPEKRLS